MKYNKAVRAIICLFALVCYAESKLVVYGPQELIDKFNTDPTKDTKKSKSTSNALTSSILEPVINANYANFGHIPYGQSLVSSRL